MTLEQVAGNEIQQYSPYIAIVIVALLQSGIFATVDKVKTLIAEAKAETLKDVSQNYATSKEFQDLKEDLREIKRDLKLLMLRFPDLPE